MKIDKIYIPVENLIVGDIILISKESILLSSDSFNEDRVKICIIEKKSIPGSCFTILGVAASGGICQTKPIYTNICIELVEYSKRIALPCFVRNIEIGDEIISPISGSIAIICNIEYRSYNNNLNLSFTERVYGLKCSFQTIIADFNDLLVCPIHSFGPLITESAEFHRNVSLLTSNSYNEINSKCYFNLFDSCNEMPNYVFNETPLCYYCILKIAAIGVYSNAASIRKYQDLRRSIYDIQYSN